MHARNQPKPVVLDPRAPPCTLDTRVEMQQTCVHVRGGWRVLQRGAFGPGDGELKESEMMCICSHLSGFSV
jgi:hypothetical protein